jgi:hypothetical protein
MGLFLDDDEMAQLTGRKTKAAQIRALRAMGIPHQVNAAGRAVVVVANITGAYLAKPAAAGWKSNKVKA